jgi:hypothetical protein
LISQELISQKTIVETTMKMARPSLTATTTTLSDGGRAYAHDRSGD